MHSWPLDIDDQDYVRLYHEEPGTLTALVASKSMVELVLYDPQGNMVERQVPVIRRGDLQDALVPRSVSTVPSADGRLLALGWVDSINQTRRWQTVLAFDQDGKPAGEEFVVASSVTLDDSLGTLYGAATAFVVYNAWSSIDDVAITQQGELVLSEDFGPTDGSS